MTPEIHPGVNPQIELAYEYVTQTRKHLFLTGKAGTGKTTFLHRVRDESYKRLAVVAPTGVAAINAGGETIHSLFQLPFGPIAPGSIRNNMRQMRFSRKKIALLKSLDLLIIDEISMVRADVLDGIDQVLRRFRGPDRPFGGLQLLMIGDLHQLPPVVKQHEWDLLQPHYQTPYFFGSLALRKTEVVTIELKHIYRQEDKDFIALLNKVRDNAMDPSVFDLLNSRYRLGFKPDDSEGYITLTSHNASAQNINDRKLGELPGKVSEFTAFIEGDFPEHAYPADPEFKCKVGAQVMFVKNDLSPEKRFFNGKIGRITDIGTETVTVSCPDEEEDIVVKALEWENRKFSLDKGSKEIREEIVGTFTQLPLKLAWAITIHKSQGLTFDRVIIDAQAAFAHGQVYVALSRCRTFEGIVLRSKLVDSSVKTDRVIRDYTADSRQNEPGEAELLQARREYQQGLLRELFQFKSLRQQLHLLFRFTLENEVSLQGDLAADVKALQEKAQKKVFQVGGTFLKQLEGFLAQPELPDAHEGLKERLGQAGAYFTAQFRDELMPDAEELEVLTDNQEVGKKAKAMLTDLKKGFFIRKACFEVCAKGFDSKTFARVAVDAELDYEQADHSYAIRKKSYGKVAQPELYRKLALWRDEMADQKEVEGYQILPSRSILEMVAVLPGSIASLKKIHGIGKARVSQYGKEIVEIVLEYCQERGLKTDQFATLSDKAGTSKAAGKPDTKALSLSMFEAGKSIAQIAKERGLSSGTIEGHLAYFVELGELEIFRLMEKEKVEEVAAYFQSVEVHSLRSAFDAFDGKYSFADLKLVLAYLDFEKTKTEKA